MQSYLRIGGAYDSLTHPVPDDAETIQWPVRIIDKETYHRATLSVEDLSITIYIQDSLTPRQAIDALVKSYKACAVNQPGGRR